MVSYKLRLLIGLHFYTKNNIKFATTKFLNDAKIYYRFLVTIADQHTNNVEEEDQIFSERNHIANPREYLDEKIFELFSKLPELISSSKLEIEEKLRFTLFKKKTQGSSIVFAGLADIFGHYVNNDLQIKDTETTYLYGFLFFYGLGFGLPALVGNPSLPPIDCSSENWQSTVDKYGLSYGPVNLASQVDIF